MKFNERIYNERKRLGISQEELGVRIGVSRQSISKWELATSEPDITKLKALAKMFNMSVDCLIADDENDIEDSKNAGKDVDKIPDTIEVILKRFGWLIGVYIVYVGTGLLIFSFVSLILFNTTLMLPDQDGSMLTNIFFNPLNNFKLFQMSLMFVGLIIIIIGILLAIFLKKRFNK